MILFLDAETFYTDEYSLRKMTPAEYILDPRFILNGVAFKEGLEGKPFWVDGDQVETYLKRYDPKTTMTVSHNSMFDACIFAWRYGFTPKLLCCTLSVAQATRRYLLESVSLASVSHHLGLGKKGDTLLRVKGMDLPAIKAAGLYEQYVAYGLDDVELCAGIFKELVVKGEFPLLELPILDMLLRMTVEPSFVLDPIRLAEHRNNVLVAKQRALDAIGADVKTVRQDAAFAELLRSQGIEPPTKISPITGLTKYAFAKTDEAFLALAEHENPVVQALVAARLGAKSTIEETRAQRFINISQLQWPFTYSGKGNMPMPVKFSGAHTHRGSGDWNLNVQNMTRGGELRKSLKAPTGYRVVVVDSSQIEARLVAFLAKQTTLLNLFESGADVYSNFASIIYNKPVTKESDPLARFCSKTAILGLGFGMGWMKFQRQIKIMSKNQMDTMLDLPDDEAMRIVNAYRSVYYQIPSLWRALNEVGIPILARGGGEMKVGPCIIEKGIVHMPGRLKMFYHDLKYDEGQWTFTFAGKRKRLFGGKLLENVVQYLDRILVFDAAMRIQSQIQALRPHYHLAQQAHDENGYVVEEQHVDEVKAILKEEMTQRPDWGPDLPLMCEVNSGYTYGDAK